MNRSATETPEEDTFVVELERFADLQILRYDVPGFETLPLREKKLLYCLYQASLAGRDIIWDQNYRHNLLIRHTLEAILQHFPGNRSEQAFQGFLTYMKRVWFSNGIHHHYSGHKIMPSFTPTDLERWALACPTDVFPAWPEGGLAGLLSFLEPILFDPKVDARKVNKDANADGVADSAVNFYRDLTEAEVRQYHTGLGRVNDPEPPSYGLNSQLAKQDGQMIERPWTVDGMYGECLGPMVHWLEKALAHCENSPQRETLTKLIAFYRSGDPRDFDRYNIAWLADTESTVDMIHGFIETYSDPLGYRGTFEAIVSFRDPIATKRIQAIAGAAQWFEDHSPIDDAFKKAKVTGITGTVINVVVEAGDASPATPIGVNLPNADWLCEQHGSKSVNLHNIVRAYNRVRDALEVAFTHGEAELERYYQFGALADDLHTDLHEVIGHASGRLAPGVANMATTLKNYASTIEETRADLIALYYILDPYLVELNLMPSLEVGKASYDHFIRNGLLSQLRRLQPGEQLEEDHMRNRQLIAKWALDNGQVIKQVRHEGNTYFRITDYEGLRNLFAQLLVEVQRIKSEGDYAAAKALVEDYGVKVDAELQAEVTERFAKLNMAPYMGFVNPKLMPVYNGDTWVDVSIAYPASFTQQMLEYADEFGLLPIRP